MKVPNSILNRCPSLKKVEICYSNMEEIQNRDFPSFVEKLIVRRSKIKEIDISRLVNLKEIYFHRNRLTSFHIPNNLNIKLAVLIFN